MPGVANLLGLILSKEMPREYGCPGVICKLLGKIQDHHSPLGSTQEPPEYSIVLTTMVVLGFYNVQTLRTQTILHSIVSRQVYLLRSSRNYIVSIRVCPLSDSYLSVSYLSVSYLIQLHRVHAQNGEFFHRHQR